MIESIAILGGGTAGLTAALTLKRKIPHLRVRVVRSREIGVIGVGESTNITFPQHFHEYLKVSLEEFHELVNPTWKLGIRFLWGPREEFQYPFVTELSSRYPGLSRANAAYVRPTDRWTGPISALMVHRRAFAAKGDTGVHLHGSFAYHVENVRLVAGLESLCRREGVDITDARVAAVEPGPEGVGALHLDSGERVTAGLYLDASGFRAELIGRVLDEPFLSYSRSLFNDRAVVGAWPRNGAPILPYTTAETMDAGWAWRIDHEHHIDRGYVFSSAFLTDDQAREELVRKNPAMRPEDTRIIRFVSGRRKRAWCGNVIAIGNAGGFVEPLEATAIQVVCVQSSTLVKALLESRCHVTDSLRTLYNRFFASHWDDIRNFLSIHYRFNTRLNTPYWEACRREADLAGAADLCAFWQDFGPSGLALGTVLDPLSTFGLEGYFALLSGQQVPIRHPWTPPPEEQKIWHERMLAFERDALAALTPEEAVARLRRPA